MKILSSMLLGLLVPLIAFSAGEDPRPQMHLLAKEITSLQKFLLTDAVFSSPRNEKEIKRSLGSLNEHLGYLGKRSFGDDPALKVNLALLRQHISDATRSFREGGKGYSRQMVQSSLQMCIACHTRRKAADFNWPDAGTKDVPPLDRADFLFATRQFTKGKELYESAIAGFPENHTAQWSLRRAMATLAVYYARVLEDPKSGAEYFKKLSDKDDLPIYLKQEAAAWAAEFADWAKEAPKKDPALLTESALLEEGKKLLKRDDFTIVSELGQSFHVRRLRASALFHRVLEAPGDKSPSKAIALLYLGQIYPRISSSMFFRFGEMYLKACITEYPKSSSAKACYVALEFTTAEGFSGSAGTSIPDDEQIELMRLKRIAY
jgi:hypothetical protein